MGFPSLGFSAPTSDFTQSSTGPISAGGGFAPFHFKSGPTGGIEQIVMVVAIAAVAIAIFKRG